MCCRKIAIGIAQRYFSGVLLITLWTKLEFPVHFLSALGSRRGLAAISVSVFGFYDLSANFGPGFRTLSDRVRPWGAVRSFPDTKLGEDRSEQVVAGKCSGDAIDFPLCQPKLFRNQFCRVAANHRQRRLHAHPSFRQCNQMPPPGHELALGSQTWMAYLKKRCAQYRHARARDRRYGYRKWAAIMSSSCDP